MRSGRSPRRKRSLGFLTSLAGRTLSHYRLEPKNGAGGMGEVYRRVDTRLTRPAAVKIVRPDLCKTRAAPAVHAPRVGTIEALPLDDDTKPLTSPSFHRTVNGRRLSRWRPSAVRVRSSFDVPPHVDDQADGPAAPSGIPDALGLLLDRCYPVQHDRDCRGRDIPTAPMYQKAGALVRLSAQPPASRLPRSGRAGDLAVSHQA